LPEMSGKQIELLKEVLPELKRVAILGDPAINALQFAATRTAARSLGVEPETVEVQVQPESTEARSRNGFEIAIEAAKAKHAEAGVLLSSPGVFGQMTKIAEFATEKRLPLISLFDEFPRVGGFMAYGPNLPDSFQKCGNYAGRILQGAKPGDLPIVRPERFELVINLKAAKALGITLPPALMQRVTRVVE
jgi:putative tryptophan/tyrosine transport system substrate-binding protein